jgi:outer membrane protein assembly factor BamB
MPTLNPTATSPAPTPVITCLGQCLVAVHPDTGELLWTKVLDRPLRRLLVAWKHLFYADQGKTSEVVWLDIHTGELKGSIEAGFDVTAALALGTRLYFAGPRGMLCITADGSSVFRVDLAPGEIVGADADGCELWRLPSGGTPGEGVLLVGDAVAQPDIDT